MASIQLNGYEVLFDDGIVCGVRIRNTGSLKR